MNLPGSDKQEAVIAAWISACAEMPVVGFDSDNPFFRSRYASLGAVVSASLPSLKKHGLWVQQVPTFNDEQVSVSTRIVHSSGQWIDFGAFTIQLGEIKGKSLIQEIGSLVTYCRRYGWSVALGLYSDEDTDGNSQAQQHGKEPEATTAKKGIPTDKTRLWALNKLQAAPGQPNREIFTQYLRYQKWVPEGGQPEEWKLSLVVASIEGLKALAQDVARWDEERHQPAEGVTP